MITASSLQCAIVLKVQEVLLKFNRSSAALLLTSSGMRHRNSAVSSSVQLHEHGGAGRAPIFRSTAGRC